MVLHAVRFVLELALVAALAVAGAAIGWWAAVLLPVAVMITWGRFLAPRSPRRLSDPLRLGIEVALFLASGVALSAAGHPASAILLTGSSIAVAVAVRRVPPPPGVG